MEYSDLGDLLHLISRYQELGKYMKEEEAWKIIIQVVKGLRVLHKNGIIHRDLKPSNIFLFKDGRVKLGDFNVASFENTNESCLTMR